jgi:galactose mutarotase-like enzyme
MAIELRSKTARAVILPEYGGRLHQVFITHGGGEEPLLWGPADPAAYTAAPTRGGAFPMAPWPNRVAAGRFPWEAGEYELPLAAKPNAIHGTVSDVPWRVVARTARVCELAVDLGGRWPWPGTAWQRIEISDTSLRMKLEVRSSRDAFPAGAGWHPWFRRDAFGAGDVRVTIPAAARYLAVDDLPTGEVVEPADEYDLRDGAALGGRRIDTCYRELSGAVGIDWGALSLRIDVAAPAPHVMCFTPEYAFCIEPQTCAVDAFNLDARGVHGVGMAVAAPMRPVGIETRWTWALAGGASPEC